MSTPDSLTTALLQMSDVQYGILILKMLGVLAGAIGGIVAAAVAVVRVWGWAWKKALDSMKADLAASFCTPKQLEEAMEKVSSRLNEGDARMQRTEVAARDMRDTLGRMERQWIRILTLLAADGRPENPTLRAAIESDSHLPVFDLPDAGRASP